MKPISRRDFLKYAGAGFGALALNQLLASCSPRIPSTPTAQPTPFPTQAIQPPPTEGATAEAAATDSPTSTSSAYLAVARNGDPETMVRRAVAALGGMERFVPSGASVIIKPNICVAYHTYEYAATTNPWVVGALVKLAFEAGAGRVRVMDFPFGGSPEEAYAISGIQEQVEAAGGEMEVMNYIQFVDTELPNAETLNHAEFYDQFLQGDVLIDVPIAKNHGMAGLTLGMKNLMGCILNREAIHSRFETNLPDLAGFLKPSLTVVDCVRMLMNNGPTGGDLNDVQEMNTIVASPDIVAADAYACTLFDKSISDIPYIAHGAQIGLGRSDLENLDIEEINAGA